MDLKHLSDSELLNETKASVKDERSSTFKVLHHLREVETRVLHLKEGRSSMFEFCMKDMGYDEHQTQRRLAAMRLLREVPQIASQIASGKISMTALNKAKTVFNKMAKKDEPVKKEKKLEILKSLESKSTKECEMELIKICPEELPKKQETQRLLTEDLTELKIIFNNETLAKLTRLKELFSHQNLKMTTAELIDKLADQGLQKMDPLRKNARKTRSKTGQKSKMNGATVEQNAKRDNAAPHAPAQVIFAKNQSRYIPSTIRHAVWIRDQARCAFISPTTNKRCDSRFKLEIDHIKPFARGGENSMENLRILCRNHNIYKAVQTYGAKKMEKFVPSLGVLTLK